MEVNNDSKTLIIILHEIYGVNEHIKSVCQQFAEKGYDVASPEYKNTVKTFGYNQTRMAYNHFLSDTGFEAGHKKLMRL